MKNEKIKLVALGGVGENGKNMFAVEVDEDIFVIDAGLMYPQNEMLGIDIVVPDITYLKQNAEKVKGIFLTHGHEDHIGGLSYFLRELDVPVYTTRLTAEFAKEKMKEQDFKGQARFEIITSKSVLKFPSATVSFFKTNHSIPDSVAVVVHTSEGAIVYTGDFKFDQTAAPLYKAEYGEMAKIGDKGVLCLLSESTDADKPGYSVSDATVTQELYHAFLRANGRVIAAVYATDLNRIQHIFDAAAKTKRKVAIMGKNLQRILNIALRNNYLLVEEDVLVSLNEVQSYSQSETIILTTGAKGEPVEALQKMARKHHKQVTIGEGDTILFSASPTLGSEVFVGKTIDMLYRAGAKVISGNKLFNSSNHGSQEELKFMINVMKPKYFLPIHGEYRLLHVHAKIAEECGVNRKNISIPEIGEVIEWKDGKFRNGGKISAGNLLIDGSGIGDVGNIVLRDRKLLSQDGILTVVVTLNKAERKISAGPEIITRGFVYVRESEQLLEEAATRVKDIVEKSISKESFDWTGIKQDIRDTLNQFLYEKTKRRPMILPIIMEVKPVRNR
ncbi:ribonuclease J [Niallia nealsonii]|uniref:Ribonuclease J n=1 Tax=Niallia nealsonii TaxID=115979 RepID=A0A2N0Z0Q1_9BACI|nr:ribonuclease J [Niallia nealsonii]PKG23084.1 Zn-dependent hydrolase [Niallia nealsonii]